jgi:hypothetical protein
MMSKVHSDQKPNSLEKKSPSAMHAQKISLERNASLIPHNLTTTAIEKRKPKTLPDHERKMMTNCRPDLHSYKTILHL